MSQPSSTFSIRDFCCLVRIAGLVKRIGKSQPSLVALLQVCLILEDFNCIFVPFKIQKCNCLRLMGLCVGLILFYGCVGGFEDFVVIIERGLGEELGQGRDGRGHCVSGRVHGGSTCFGGGCGACLSSCRGRGE